MNRSFYAILVSQTATNLAYAIYAMVVVLHLYHETGSTTLSAAVTLISMLAHILSGIVLPAFSDRFQPLRLLITSQVAQLLLLMALALVISRNYSSINLIITFGLLSVISFCHGWFSPIKSSLVRAAVAENERVRAVSLLSTADQTFLFLGWTFGGLMLALIGKEASLAVSFGLLLVSAGGLFLVTLKESIILENAQGMWTRLTAGWKLLYRHDGLRVILVMDLVESWAGAVWIGAVTLTFVQEALHQGEAWWGYINGAYFLGTMIGGFFVFRLSAFLRGHLRGYMLAGSVVFALLSLVYGMTSNAFVALALVLLMGPASQIRDLTQEVMFQNAAEPHTLTKILAARTTIMQVIFVFSIAGIGTLIDFMGVRIVYILEGCLFLLSAAYGYYHLIVRKKGKLLEAPEAAG